MTGRIRRIIGTDRIAEELSGVRQQLASMVIVPPPGGDGTAPVAEPPRAPDLTESLRAEVTQLRDELAALRAHLADQAARVADLRSALSAATGGLRTESLGHEQLADRYQALVTHHFLELARLRLARGTDRAGRERSLARLVRALVSMMLTGGPVDEDDLAAWLAGAGNGPLTDAERRAVESACDQTRRLRADLARGRQPVTLVDEVPRGEPPAAGTTRPWRGCPADGRTEFVVAPAYVVAGEALAPALVFTTAGGHA